jgi:hypothetical protein
MTAFLSFHTSIAVEFLAKFLAANKKWYPANATKYNNTRTDAIPGTSNH